MIEYDNPIKLYYDVGRIVKMIIDFEPVILEQGANPLELEAENEMISENSGIYQNWQSYDDDQDYEEIV